MMAPELPATSPPPALKESALISATLPAKPENEVALAKGETALTTSSTMPLAVALIDAIPSLVVHKPEVLENDINSSLANDPYLSQIPADQGRIACARFLLVKEYNLQFGQNLERPTDKPLGAMEVTLPVGTSCYDFLERMQKFCEVVHGAPCIDKKDMARWSTDPTFTEKMTQPTKVMVATGRDDTAGMTIGEVQKSFDNIAVAPLARIAVAYAAFAAFHERKDLLAGTVVRALDGTLYSEDGELQCGHYDREHGNNSEWKSPHVHAVLEPSAELLRIYNFQPPAQS